MEYQETLTETYISCLDIAQMIAHHQWDPPPQSNEISYSLDLHIHHQLTTSPPLQTW